MKAAKSQSPTSTDIYDVLIQCGPGKTPPGGMRSCTFDMEWAASDFSFGRNWLLGRLLTAKPEGYSQGWHDLVSDIFSPLHN
jgi:hypothetical protein